MECGCLRVKRFGAIDGTPVAPTEGTSQRAIAVPYGGKPFLRSSLRRETLLQDFALLQGCLTAPHWLENSTGFERDKTQEVRMLREIIFGKKRSRRFGEITTGWKK